MAQKTSDSSTAGFESILQQLAEFDPLVYVKDNIAEWEAKSGIVAVEKDGPSPQNFGKQFWRMRVSFNVTLLAVAMWEVKRTSSPWNEPVLPPLIADELQAYPSVVLGTMKLKALMDIPNSLQIDGKKVSEFYRSAPGWDDHTSIGVIYYAEINP